MIPHRRLLWIALTCFGLGLAMLSLSGCARYRCEVQDVLVTFTDGSATTWITVCQARW